jgi:hypothetical protein
MVSGDVLLPPPDFTLVDLDFFDGDLRVEWRLKG